MQLCQRFHRILSKFPGRAPTPPYPQLEFFDPVLPRDSFDIGRVFCFKAFVRENRKGNGSVITIVVGGAAEGLSAHPGTADLTLRKRCVVLSSARFDAEVDWWLCLPDWGSSSSRFGKGMSYNLLCTGHALMLRLHSADLVPVFSFGENDVRLLAYWAYVYAYTDDALDLRTNA